MRGRASFTLALSAILMSAGASTAAAQYSACLDTLALFSPTNLTVRYEDNGVPGTRLRWDEYDPALTSCFRLSINADLDSRLQPQLQGDYTAKYDRFIGFTALQTGVVGTTTQDLMQFSISSTNVNPDVPPLVGTINLSNRGGLFVVDVSAADAVATQRNQGVSNHLPFTDVTSIATWSASDNSSHRIYAAVSGLPLIRSDDGGANWVEPALNGVDPIGFPITHLAVSPGNRDLLFAGTSNAGLWSSTDGGVTFQLADAAIRPAGTVSGSTVLRYLRRAGGGHRLYVGMSGLGFFRSDDDGTTWTRSTTFLVPALSRSEEVVLPGSPPDTLDVSVDNCPDEAATRQPRVLSLAQSPVDPDVVYAGVGTWGVYRTTDGGGSWNRVNADLVSCGPEADEFGFPIRSGVDIDEIVVLDNGGTEWVVAASPFDGVFFSADQGTTWLPAQGVPTDPTSGIALALTDFVVDPSQPQRLIAATPTDGLYESTNSGANWSALAFGASPIYTSKVGSIAANPGRPDEILVGTTGAGVYRAGEPIDLTRAIRPPTGVHTGADISFGLSMSFQGGSVGSGERFDLLTQSFQGYAVWRAEDINRQTGEPYWELIGLYDRLNPESCSPSACDVLSPIIRPGCYANKRANCFTFNSDGTAEFFDREIFSGFTYQYSVTTYDYLYGGLTTPRGFSGEMWFSPRSAAESSPESLPFVGYTPTGAGDNFNQVQFQVNIAATSNLDRVYVVPNPLRRRAGWDTGDGSSVRFFNVTLGSICEVYTLSGDLVARLGNVVDQGAEKGLIQWDTKNQSGNLVASGVYIYRITNRQGEELIDRFTIIR